MRIPIQNIEKIQLIRLLRKNAGKTKSPIWKKTAELLERPKRKSVSVNLSRINRSTKKNDFIVIPGKALSAGSLKHPVTVAAFAFSSKAKEKIEKAGGKCIHIKTLMTQNPEGSRVKLLA